MDLTLHDARATATQVHALLKDRDTRTRLCRIVDAERGVEACEAKFEAQMLAEFIYLETVRGTS